MSDMPKTSLSGASPKPLGEAAGQTSVSRDFQAQAAADSEPGCTEPRISRGSGRLLAGNKKAACVTPPCCTAPAASPQRNFAKIL